MKLLYTFHIWDELFPIEGWDLLIFSIYITIIIYQQEQWFSIQYNCHLYISYVLASSVSISSMHSPIDFCDNMADASFESVLLCLRRIVIVLRTAHRTCESAFICVKFRLLKRLSNCMTHNMVTKHPVYSKVLFLLGPSINFPIHY